MVASSPVQGKEGVFMRSWHLFMIAFMAVTAMVVLLLDSLEENSRKVSHNGSIQVCSSCQDEFIHVRSNALPWQLDSVSIGEAADDPEGASPDPGGYTGLSLITRTGNRPHTISGDAIGTRG
jgi:hypothetical protein